MCDVHEMLKSSNDNDRKELYTCVCKHIKRSYCSLLYGCACEHARSNFYFCIDPNLNVSVVICLSCVELL